MFSIYDTPDSPSSVHAGSSPRAVNGATTMNRHSSVVSTLERSTEEREREMAELAIADLGVATRDRVSTMDFVEQKAGPRIDTLRPGTEEARYAANIGQHELEDRINPWKNFKMTTEDRDLEAEKLDSLHDGQLHRAKTHQRLTETQNRHEPVSPRDSHGGRQRTGGRSGRRGQNLTRIRIPLGADVTRSAPTPGTANHNRNPLQGNVTINVPRLGAASRNRTLLEGNATRDAPVPGPSSYNRNLLERNAIRDAPTSGATTRKKDAMKAAVATGGARKSSGMSTQQRNDLLPSRAAAGQAQYTGQLTDPTEFMARVTGIGRGLYASKYADPPPEPSKPATQRLVQTAGINTSIYAEADAQSPQLATSRSDHAVNVRDPTSQSAESLFSLPGPADEIDDSIYEEPSPRLVQPAPQTAQHAQIASMFDIPERSYSQISELTLPGPAYPVPVHQSSVIDRLPLTEIPLYDLTLPAQYGTTILRARNAMEMRALADMLDEIAALFREKAVVYG
ncbi:hypothetical protein B0A49_08033 [Cryomyces minteri]|uniref:Uncharacterized protein n=1 Tax=Cryomyces minteri TaxID=331657 RepID=A0A4U0X9S7_9PEZI|nr:hypothetical protein B0A49_08033 [Cryomyces minteri]